MKGIKNYIRAWDMFGRPVNLRFNKKGETYNTFFGGIFGITVRVVIILYIGLIGTQWVNHSGNTYTSQI